jgi:serine O-acetyltransferase
MKQEEYIKQLYFTHTQKSNLPNSFLVESFLASLLAILFPSYNNKAFVTFEQFEEEVNKSKRQLEHLLLHIQHELTLPLEDLIDNFYSELERVHQTLLLDAKSIEAGDPAAKSTEEVIRTYPGFYAISIYRIAHLLFQLNVPFIPRMFTELAHSKTGIDIHPGASIGLNFFIDHGTGIVIGETTIIGNDVKIYQGVTLGALSVTKDLAETKRHPTIEDNVVIYAGATILGGKTVIGSNSIIGGNVWLTDSIEPNSLVYHKAEVVIKKAKNYE